jgi:hypothetical protein
METKTQKFISKAELKHGNKYDYSLVNYFNNTTKVKIICLKHSEFEQTPSAHLRGQGCPKCNNRKKTNLMNTKKLIDNLVNSNQYNYSLVNYIDDQTKIKIICSTHGIFEQLPKIHLNGSGCPKCKYDLIANKTKLTNNIFIQKAKNIHGDKYDYSLVEYVNNRVKIKIICPVHGEFEQQPSGHLTGNGCSLCGNKNLDNNKFIEKSKLVHLEKYNYTLVDNIINNKSKVKIMCQIHGVFEQKVRHHLNGAGCPKCNESRGEREVKNYLIKNNIKFIPQKRFPDCKDKKELPFDFYLSELNTCIEFNGRQHYEEIKYWGGQKGLDNQQRRDKIKIDYCLNKKIKLIIINNVKKIDDNLKWMIKKN